MTTTIAGLAADPSPLTAPLVVAGTAVTLRALLPADTAALTAFLAGLSDTSRAYWHGDVDAAEQAAEWVDAIGRHDKLRLVATCGPTEIVGMVDLSFCVPDHAELGRYAGYGVALDPDRTVRFGPCVADAWQGTGLAAAMLPPAWDAVRLLGRDRVVLYGGVAAANARARRFYRRHGFVEVGEFPDGVDMMMRAPL